MADNQVAQANQEPTPIHNHQVPESTPSDNHQSREPSPVNPLAEQFSRIAKQEKFVAEERKKIEEAKKAFEADKQEVSKYKGLKGKDPFEILEHFGISYDQLLEADKNRRTTPMDPMAKKALETVEQLRLQLDSKEKEAERERHSRAEIKLMSEIATTIRDNEYDLIEKLGEESAVREYMEEMYAQTGEIPDIKEACEAITESLVAKISAVKESKWLRPKETQVEEPNVDETAKNVHTLSNKLTQSTTAKDKAMTEAERMRAAIDAMNAVKSK